MFGIFVKWTKPHLEFADPTRATVRDRKGGGGGASTGRIMISTVAMVTTRPVVAMAVETTEGAGVQWSAAASIADHARAGR